jgi:hypothetical protein
VVRERRRRRTRTEPGQAAAFLELQRARADRLSVHLAERLEQRRESAPVLDFAVGFYERDRDSFGSVLGSAVALRLFLLQVPGLVLVVGLINLLAGSGAVAQMLGRAGVGAEMAGEIERAATTSGRGSIALVVLGLALSSWAGRSLTRVLAACAAGAWRLGGRDARPSLRTTGAVTALVLGTYLSGALLNRIREDSGLAVATTGLVAVGLVYGVGWFLVTWTLPRGTSDPGALLPGAALLGVAMAGLQWFMQFYLPGRIDRSSAVLGSIGLSVAILGYLFIIGRLMTLSFVLDAVVMDYVGSISEVVFALPGLRRVASRWPAVARFFDLPGGGQEDPAGPVLAGPAGPSGSELS